MSEPETPARDTLDMVTGCLLGGAVGEALGRRSMERSPAGAGPIGDAGGPDDAAMDGQAGAIGWRTQMTVMTAEGLLRADNRTRARGFAAVDAVVHNAYRRWLVAQGDLAPDPSGLLDPSTSWLLRLPALTERRGAGETTLAALRAGVAGRPGQPINDSKGCGAITRIAPVGLTPPAVDVGRLAMEVAALTHGHAIAQLAAGVVAVIIHRLMARRALEEAVGDGLAWLLWAQRERADGPALASLVDPLRRVMRSEVDALATAVRAGEFGAGHTADEALAIALACVRAACDFEHGVRLAVGHGGVRDATGVLTGQILGTALGAAAAPERWLDALDVRDALVELGRDWDRHFFGGGARDEAKYPGF
jgi:ADP-ribosylglycohydrolase